VKPEVGAPLLVGHRKERCDTRQVAILNGVVERNSLHEIDLFLEAKNRLLKRAVQFPGAADQVIDTLGLAAASGDVEKRDMAARDARNAPLKDRERKKKQLGREKRRMEQDFQE
jgi:hypothetical protein